LENHRRAQPARGALSDEGGPPAPTVELPSHGEHLTRPRRREGMTQGDGATVNVEAGIFGLDGPNGLTAPQVPLSEVFGAPGLEIAQHLGGEASWTSMR